MNNYKLSVFYLFLEGNMNIREQKCDGTLVDGILQNKTVILLLLRYEFEWQTKYAAYTTPSKVFDYFENYF